MGPGPDAAVGGPRRLGLFGGTFDPPHNGHVSAAGDVADALGLDEIVWMPARRSPHKQHTPITEVEIRLAMVRAAADTDSRFRVCDEELKRPGPSYTVDTLRALHDRGVGDEWFLIMGIDQYRSFDRWRAPEEVRSLATIVVMDRGGGSVDELVPGRAVVRLAVRRIDVSGTEVRDRVRAGRDVSDAVPPAVARIIESEGLYRS